MIQIYGRSHSRCEGCAYFFILGLCVCVVWIGIARKSYFNYWIVRLIYMLQSNMHPNGKEQQQNQQSWRKQTEHCKRVPTASRAENGTRTFFKSIISACSPFLGYKSLYIKRPYPIHIMRWTRFLNFSFSIGFDRMKKKNTFFPLKWNEWA